MTILYLSLLAGILGLALLVYGIINAPTVEAYPSAVCTPSRARLLTGANLSREQIVAIQQDSEELQRQAAEIERLRAVIRQRNRTIKCLRSQQEQTAEQPVTVGKNSRFELLEIRGQS